MRRQPALVVLLLAVGCGARTELGALPPIDAGSSFDADSPHDTGLDAPHDAGSPPDAPACTRDDECDDRLDCTEDRCVDGRCRSRPDDVACDDGLFCSGVERCVPGRGCIATPPDCADTVACTVDRCDETEDACVRDPDAALCPISHRCDSVAGCVARALAHDASQLYEIDLPSGTLHALAPTPVTLTDIALHPDGTLYGAVQNALVRVDYEASTVERVVEVDGPFVGLDIAPDGTVYGSVDRRVVRFDLELGTAVRVATYPAGLRASGDIAFVDGRLYATVMGGRGGDWLVEVPLAPDLLPRVVGATGFERIWGLAPFGDTLYGLTRGGELIRIELDDGSAIQLARPGAMFYGAGAR